MRSRRWLRTTASPIRSGPTKTARGAPSFTAEGESALTRSGNSLVFLVQRVFNVRASLFMVGSVLLVTLAWYTRAVG